jgi:hypothetical protein
MLSEGDQRANLPKEADGALWHTHLVQYGSKWVYNFPTPSRLKSRCPQGNTWGIGTQTLEGAGLVENAIDCEFTTDGLRIITELNGAARYKVETPLLFPPQDVLFIETHELPDVKAALTPVSENWSVSETALRRPERPWKSTR